VGDEVVKLVAVSPAESDRVLAEILAELRAINAKVPSPPPPDARLAQLLAAIHAHFGDEEFTAPANHRGGPKRTPARLTVRADLVRQHGPGPRDGG
jgi:hypothetical protein